MRSSIDDKAVFKSPTAVLVRRLRIELGLTQQQLAARAGVSFSFVNQVEGGKPTVRLDALNKVLQVFGYAMAPSRTAGAFAAQSAWSSLYREEPASAPAADPVAVTEPVRQRNDWAFYK